MKPASQYDIWQEELDKERALALDKEALIRTILKVAENGGFVPDKCSQLKRWNVHRIRRVCMMLEEKGVLVCNEGVYTRNE